MPLLLRHLLMHQPQWLASQLQGESWLQRLSAALVLLLLLLKQPPAPQQQQQRPHQRSLEASSHQSKVAAIRCLTCPQPLQLVHTMLRQPLLPLHTLLALS
jgi:hypothetical protein